MDTSESDLVRAVLGESGDAVFAIDREDRITSVITGTGFVGRRPQELIGRTISELLPAPAAAIVCEGMSKVRATNAPRIVEHRRPSPAGERIVRARLVPAGDGTLIAYIRDITHAMDIETALQKSAETLRLLARATSDVLFDWDAATDRSHWNEGLASSFGYESEMVTDIAWWLERVHPDDKEAVGASVRAAMEDPHQEIWTGEYRFRAADGRWLSVFERTLFVRDEAGRAIRAVGSMLDVTNKKLLEGRLQMTERLSALGTFAAGLAHEINEPLGAALASLGLAQEKCRENDHDGLPELLRDAEAGARRVAAVADGLANFVRMRIDDDGRSPVDMRAVIHAALKVARRDIEKLARVELALDEAPPVRGSAAQLGQVLLNLLANSRHALAQTPAPDHRLRIALKAEPHSVVVEIEDSGAGIAAEHLPVLFDPFFTTKPAEIGTGLGLAICREIVHGHGGTIEAEAGRARGALFRMTLPFVDVEAPRGDERAVQSKRLRILVVDDDALTRAIMCRILEPAHEVVAVGSVHDAAARIGQQPFDVILSDVNMPNGGGAQLHDLAHARGVGARFAYVTASAEGPATLAPVLRKPFRAETLRAFVDDVGSR